MVLFFLGLARVHHFLEGHSHMKRSGMLFVATLSASQSFWSHLGCSGQNITSFRESSFNMTRVVGVVVEILKLEA